MAPIRRYLRISKYTILECRIYLENPADTRWLLDSRDSVLPRIFTAVRPLILPKLREENERLLARKKGKPVKDVIAEEDFEVSLFLRESRTRHSLLTRHKEFDEPKNTLREGMGNQSGPMKGSSGGVDGGIVVESDSESNLDLHDIPQATAEEGNDSRGKRRRNTDEPVDTAASRRVSKRRKDEEPDDKKMRFRTNYEGFNIYGWVLCLLVTRKGDKAGAKSVSSESTRQALMEEWMSTQAQGVVDEEQDVS
ncbi:uncharacterized protein BDW43DRAFT_38599 [Aspergillus alliaceus]|uniref:uncharacterized protein n=1 Tax=Petromyces alliaceus TaxID=209559 RepID=UPI0012A6DF90|nr:uncharacterized protein BDW43DRAFT_38599 [Aspergillus alliaceus]KAB8235078.1 hypothetical protein BDW43DRAFT_38599 [Aspergillus alliaceus]